MRISACAWLTALALAGCHKPPFEGEPPLLGGDQVVEHVCTDTRYAAVPEHAQCARAVDVVRVRVPLRGRALVALSIRDARDAAVDGPIRVRNTFTLDGKNSDPLDDLGPLGEVDNPTAQRLLEALALGSHWGRLRTEADLAQLAEWWPAAATRVRQEPSAFLMPGSARVLRWWEVPERGGRGVRCRQLVRREASLDAEGRLQLAEALTFGEVLPGRTAPTMPQGCGLPLAP